MSNKITHYDYFNQIHDFDQTQINAARLKNSEEAVRRITKLALDVITFCQATDDQSDIERIMCFSEKLGFINNQFNEEGKGTPFAVHLFTLSLLISLKTALPQSNQAILQHP